MSHIYVTDLDGSERRLDAVEGWRVMEIIREHGLSIRARDRQFKTRKAAA